MRVQVLIEQKNKKLFAKIKEYFKIKLKEKPDWREFTWSSAIEKDTLIIQYCPTYFPRACFTHELLLAEAQINGFKKVFSGISLNKDTQQFLPTLIKYLNRTFQHHKIAAPFLLMGYPPEQFYDAEEYQMVDYLLLELSKEGHSQLYLSLLYLDFITPLAGISEDQEDALQIAFDEYEGGKYRQSFLQIDKIINNWTKDTAYNAEAYFIDFLSTIGIKDTWLSYEKNAPDNLDQHFPDSGFFVGSPFTILDFENRIKE